VATERLQVNSPTEAVLICRPPTFRKESPCMSAALRRRPAFFRAFVFSGPAGINRAASRASMASVSKMAASRERRIRFHWGSLAGEPSTA
jgi:hypothetical protein